MSNYHLRCSVEEFISLCKDGTIAERLKAAHVSRTGQEPSDGELKSWRKSLPALATVLDRPAFKRLIVYLEHGMPNIQNKRCDVILAGVDVDGSPTFLIIELKQWEYVSGAAGPESVLIRDQRRTHPSYQAESYARWMVHYHEAATKHQFSFRSCAWLHNLKDPASIAVLRAPNPYQPIIDASPLYAAEDGEALASFILMHVAHGDATAQASIFDAGRYCPSDRLLDVIDRVVSDATLQRAETSGAFANVPWVLLDEQVDAYNAVHEAVKRARATGTRAAVIVRGGPGTGKSVIAIHLLAEGARRRWRVQFAAGTKAWKTVLQAKTIHLSAKLNLARGFVRGATPIKEIFAPSRTSRSMARLPRLNPRSIS